MVSASRNCSLTLLLLAEFGAMSLWFVPSAILPELARDGGLGPWETGVLSMAVQIGFVVGALALALLGTSDRFDPRHVFGISALLAAAANLSMIFGPPGGGMQIFARALTGMCLAGVYPVGMKIAVGWTRRRRGLLIGALIAAVAFGSAAPHGIRLIGGAHWQTTVVTASLMATVAGLLIFLADLGPHHVKASAFQPRELRLLWQLKAVRLATMGYIGHMWELYAFWAWIGSAVTASLRVSGHDTPEALSELVTFVSIALGASLCIPAGALADRMGRAQVAGSVMVLSGCAALATALSFGGPVWLTITFALVWGMLVIPDSAQFSALVADAAPAEAAGSLITLQTALGFLLTTLTIQAAPLLAVWLGWSVTLALFGLGPLLGAAAMCRLIVISTMR